MQLLQRMTGELVQTAIAASRQPTGRKLSAPGAILTAAATKQVEAFVNAVPAFGDPKAREAVAAALAVWVIDEIAKRRPALIDIFVDSPFFYVILRPHCAGAERHGAGTAVPRVHDADRRGALAPCAQARGARWPH